MYEGGIYEVIGRVLSGQSDESDKDELKKWLNESRENQLLYEKLKEGWHKASASNIKILGSEDVKSKIWKSVHSNGGHKPIKPNLNRLHVYYTAAVVAIFIISLLFVGEYLSSNSGDKNHNVNYVIKENAKGRKSTIFLNDGSVVYLNSDSKVRYPEVFPDSSRVVYLQGEAFFEVTANQRKPFIVVSQKIKTTVLGTAFNVASYHDENEIKVSLAKGSIKVTREKSPNDNDQEVHILKPGQEISYHKVKNSFSEIEAFDTHEVLGWKDGILYFNKADFAKIKDKLERWYGLEIVVQSKAYPEMSYTGEFQNQTLKDVLQSISFVQNFDFEIQNESVLIRFNEEIE